MPIQPLYDFYEKMYFHEVEAREHLTVRLQIPLALLISVAGALVVMLQNLERNQAGNWLEAFILLFLAASFFIVVSAFNCYRSAWGHTYSLMPTSNTWHEYHQDCIRTYAAFADHQKISVDAAIKCIHEKYIECATKNAEINQLRVFYYHLTIKYFVLAVAFGVLAFSVLYFGGLDKSMHSKPTEISVVSPIQLKGTHMTTPQQPLPPPPPPPPTRFVKDDKHPAPQQKPR